MHDTIKQLYDLLKQELACYHSLADMIQSEQSLVRERKFELLTELVARKNTLAQIIHAHELKRKNTVTQLARRMNCPSQNFRMSLLLEKVPTSGRQLLESIREDLKLAIQRVQRESQKLERMSGAMMAIYRDTLDYILKEAGGKPAATYTAHNRTMSRGAVQSVMVSTQA